MEFIENIIPGNLIYALGTMLLHMFWQAIIIAFLLGFVLILLRKSSPQSRYVAALSAFSLMPVTAVLTFISQWNAFSYYSEVQAQAIPLGTYQTTGNTGILDQLLALYADYLPVIVFIWIIGVTVLLLKSLGQLIVLHRLKSYYLKELAGAVEDTVQRIIQKFRINKKVQTFISLKAGSPMIIGHRKPVLLLPESTVNHLSSAELKAVLQHELAHIKRNDYIINLFQSIIEILFFFHPATWWMSAIIRKEREECCDVYAIENEQDKLNLAKALSTLQEMEINSSTLAMTALRNNKNLLKRIKHMFTNRPVTPSFKEGIIVTLFFVALVTFMSFVLNEAPANQTNTVDETNQTVNTELPNGKHLFAKTDEDGNIQKLYVEGKKIPKRKFSDYRPVVDSLLLVQMDNHAQQSDNDEQIAVDPKAIEAEIQKTLDEINQDLSDEKKVQLRDSTGPDNGLVSQILSEVTNSVSEELKREFGKDFEMRVDDVEGGEKVVMRIDGNNFVMDINDEQEKVVMRMDEQGFVMDVNEDGEQVKMRFDSNGFYINVTENGKKTVNIQFGPNGAVFDVED